LITPWITFTYEHQFEMKIIENYYCPVTILNMASFVPTRLSSTPMTMTTGSSQRWRLHCQGPYQGEPQRSCVARQAVETTYRNEAFF
jgi:hypothetical protein